MRTHHCETHLCNSRSITILPPATENVTRLATNKRFANVQLMTNTTTVPRYLLSCWLKRSAHLFALLSGQKYNESARQTNTSQNTASAVWQNGGPSRQGDYHVKMFLLLLSRERLLFASLPSPMGSASAVPTLVLSAVKVLVTVLGRMDRYIT